MRILRNIRDPEKRFRIELEAIGGFAALILICGFTLLTFCMKEDYCSELLIKWGAPAEWHQMLQN